MLMKTADGVTCLRAIGARVWAGLASGHVQVWDLSMAPLATVGVHVGPVKDITHVGARAYTLGEGGLLVYFSSFLWLNVFCEGGWDGWE